MSRESGQQLRGGARACPVAGSRVGLGAGALGLILGLLFSASAALAAEIVEVRVGKHPEFTRVVFELDRAVGYRIERATPEPGVSELVVSLEATSIPRRIRASKSLIEQVEVQPSGSRTVARIRLAKSDLKLKEMILASPPRIVLDVLSDQPVAKKATKKSEPPASETATAQRAATQKPAVQTAQETAAKTTDEATEKPAKTIARVPTATKIAGVQRAPSSESPSREPAPRQVDAKAADARAAQAAGQADTTKARETTARAAGSGESRAMALVREREQQLAAAAADEPSTSTPIARAAEDATAAKQAKAKAERRAQKKAAQPAARPMVAKTPEAGAEAEGGGWLSWALAGVGAIVLLAGGFLYVRSRAAGEEVDFEAEEAGAPETDDAPVPFAKRDAEGATEGGADANPFAGLGGESDQMSLGAAEATSAATGMGEDRGSSGAFGFGDTEDTEEKDMDGMEVISRDAASEGLGGMPAAMGTVPEEFQQMMREMNRRVEALESRIDELVDARDRLERQVAAQTEELRVQRAAIARTQRAVRNLARPEDEQEATEPALRDPNKPSPSE